MNGYQTPFFIGSLKLKNNVFCAPLAGCSDMPFRMMNQKYGAGLVFCEMVKMDALVRHDPGTFRLLDYERGMHPLGAQLCGSKTELAAPSAKILEELGFDLIDLNCGCPVDKVTKDGSGSALLKEPERIGEMIANMVAAVKVPVTLKIRTGWDESSICASEITQIAEKAGAKVITVHGRTRKQAYVGPANWSHIRDAKNTAKTIKVFGNGDAFDAPSVFRLFEETGCDGVLVARGSFGQPWIFEDVKLTAEGVLLPIRDGKNLYKTICEHLAITESYRAEKGSVADMRRVLCWYLKNDKRARLLRDEINKVRTLEEIKRAIHGFDWESLLVEASQ